MLDLRGTQLQSNCSLLYLEKNVKSQTWTMIASIQGNPVLPSLQASSSLSSSFQGIYNHKFETEFITIRWYAFAFNKGVLIREQPHAQHINNNNKDI